MLCLFQMKTTAVKCDFCSKEFSKSSYCKDHIRIVHKRNAKGEQIETTKFTCTLCNKQYSQKKNLQRHIKSTHSSEPKQIYKCDMCTYTTIDQSSLKRHIFKFKNT